MEAVGLALGKDEKGVMVYLGCAMTVCNWLA
jgi:hypothetical protein